ncbi:MAG: hypothetical protein H7Z73_12790 [Candidatus Saccharibacteria bacterium]|nr:hypothetical protein [Moraxellaceae bacterium]
MTAYFGFTPSETLKKNIEIALAHASGGPLYLIRDKVSLSITDEIIDAAMTKLAHELPPSDKKETMEKLSSFIRSTMQTLMKQLLGKDIDEKVLKSLNFLTLSTHDKGGQLKVGCAMPDELIGKLKDMFALAEEGKITDGIRPELIILQKQMADICTKHFITDYCESLDLGFFKRNAMSIASSATTKAIHFAIHKLVPNLSKDELAIFAKHYDSLMYFAD